MPARNGLGTKWKVVALFNSGCVYADLVLADEVALHWVRSERVFVFYVNWASSTNESTHICLLATGKKLLKESLNLHRFGSTTSLVCPPVPSSHTRVPTYWKLQINAVVMVATVERTGKKYYLFFLAVLQKFPDLYDLIKIYFFILLTHFS